MSAISSRLMTHCTSKVTPGEVYSLAMGEERSLSYHWWCVYPEHWHRLDLSPTDRWFREYSSIDCRLPPRTSSGVSTPTTFPANHRSDSYLMSLQHLALICFFLCSTLFLWKKKNRKRHPPCTDRHNSTEWMNELLVVVFIGWTQRRMEERTAGDLNEGSEGELVDSSRVACPSPLSTDQWLTADHPSRRASAEANWHRLLRRHSPQWNNRPASRCTSGGRLPRGRVVWAWRALSRTCRRRDRRASEEDRKIDLEATNADWRIGEAREEGASADERPRGDWADDEAGSREVPGGSICRRSLDWEESAGPFPGGIHPSWPTRGPCSDIETSPKSTQRDSHVGSRFCSKSRIASMKLLPYFSLESRSASSSISSAKTLTSVTRADLGRLVEDVREWPRSFVRCRRSSSGLWRTASSLELTLCPLTSSLIPPGRERKNDEHPGTQNIKKMHVFYSKTIKNMPFSMMERT